MMDTYKISYSADAIDDLRVTYSYIANELLVPETAEKKINKIRSEIRKLDFMPTRHQIVDWEPWHSMGMHQLPIDKFMVYYLVLEDTKTVSIVKIIYGGRDIINIVNEMQE